MVIFAFRTRVLFRGAIVLAPFLGPRTVCRRPVDFAVGTVDLELAFMVPCAMFGGRESEVEFVFNLKLDGGGGTVMVGFESRVLEIISRQGILSRFPSFRQSHATAS